MCISFMVRREVKIGKERERERERGRLSVDDVYKSGGGCCVLFLISLHLRLANGSGMIDPILATHAPGH